jgi:uncharacterized cupredoxin-like copper-binding protein
MRKISQFLLATSCVLAWSLAVAGTLPASAEETPTFTLELDDGKITPLRLEVPAGTRFKIALVNKGSTPAEFESSQLRKEKVLAPGAHSSLVFTKLDPGEYEFIDEFHPEAPKGVIVAR